MIEFIALLPEDAGRFLRAAFPCAVIGARVAASDVDKDRRWRP